MFMPFLWLLAWATLPWQQGTASEQQGLQNWLSARSNHLQKCPSCRLLLTFCKGSGNYASQMGNLISAPAQYVCLHVHSYIFCPMMELNHREAWGPALKWCFWDTRCTLFFREATRALAGARLSCTGTTIHAQSVWLGPSSARALWLLLHQLAWSWENDLHIATDSIYSMYTELIMLLVQDKWRLWYLIYLMSI